MQQYEITHTDRLDAVTVAIAAWNTDAAPPVEETLRSLGAVVSRIAPSAPTAVDARYDVILAILHSSVDSPLPYAHELSRSVELADRQRVIALLQEPPTHLSTSLRDFELAPFRADELVARIRRVIAEPRRNGPLSAGNMVILEASREVEVGGMRVDVTFREFEILRQLLAVDGAVMTRADLAGLFTDEVVEGRAIDIHVHRLRSKLHAWRGAQIETVRGVGYRVSSTSRHREG